MYKTNIKAMTFNEFEFNNYTLDWTCVVTEFCGLFSVNNAEKKCLHEN